MLPNYCEDHLQELQQQSGCNFSYLQPSSDVNNFAPTEIDLFYWKDKEQKTRGRRRIYYGVQFEERQSLALQQIEAKFAENAIFLKFSRQLILKHLHVQNFNISKSLNRLQALQQFHYSNTTKISPKTLEYLSSGIIYTLGYSKIFQPIVIIRADRVDPQKLQLSELFNVLHYLLLVVVRYKMVPFHAEKFIILMDLNNMNLSSLPYSMMYECLNKLALYSCGFTDTNFVLNAKGIWAVWNFVKGFLPEYAIKKIKFIGEGQQHQLLEFIDKEELEEKYGGSIPNIPEEQYWPPRSTPKSKDFNPIHNQHFAEATNFYSIKNNSQFFNMPENEMQSFQVTDQVVPANLGCCGQKPIDCNIF